MKKTTKKFNKERNMLVVLIGGVGWFSTEMYYRYLNRRIDHAKDTIVVWSLPCESIVDAQASGDTQTELGILRGVCNEIAKLKPDIVAVCSVTTSKLVPELRREFSETLHFVDVHDALCAWVSSGCDGKDTLGVRFVGTRASTVHGRILGELRAVLGADKVEILESEEALQEVSRVIYEELFDGNTQSLERLKTDYFEKGLVPGRKVILGCTELCALETDKDSSSTYVNTVEVHCNAILAMIGAVRREHGVA